MLNSKRLWPVAAVFVAVLLVAMASPVVLAQAPDRGGGAPTAAPEANQPAAAPAATPPAAPAGPANNAATGPAAGGQTGAGPTSGPADQKGGYQQYMLYIMLAVLLLVFLLMGRKPRQEEKKRREMLSNLKKGDKITTIGGIIGTIVEVRENEVVVKVDEASNARMRFVRSAIRLIGTADEAEKKEENK